MTPYGLKIAVKHFRQKGNKIVPAVSRFLPMGEVTDIGAEAGRLCPFLKRGDIVIAPYIPAADINGISYVNINTVIAYIPSDETNK